MRIIWTIAIRETRSAFTQPVAPVAIGLFVLILAVATLWMDDLLLGGVVSLRGPLLWMSVGISLLAPALTMGSIAGERQRGTLQILGTWPIGPLPLILGKWIGVVMLITLALLLTLPWPLALAYLGPLDPGPVLIGYLGVWGLGAALCAVGVAASAWTQRPVVALCLALGLSAAPWLWGNALTMLSPSWLSTAEWLSAPHHLDLWARGLLDSRSVALLGLLTVMALQTALLGLHRERLQ